MIILPHNQNLKQSPGGATGDLEPIRMGACASRTKEANSPSPVAPPAEESSAHDVATNPTEEKTVAAEAPLVDLSETKPEETPVEVSTPTAVKELAPVLSEVPAEAPVEPKKEEEKPQETEEVKAAETKEEESKATTA